MKRRGLIAAPVIAGVLLLGACSSEYSKDELITELEEEGIPSEQATCIVDGLEEAGVPLDKFDEPSAEDEEKILEVTKACIVGDSGLELPEDGAAE